MCLNIYFNCLTKLHLINDKFGKFVLLLPSDIHHLYFKRLIVYISESYIVLD